MSDDFAHLDFGLRLVFEVLVLNKDHGVWDAKPDRVFGGGGQLGALGIGSQSWCMWRGCGEGLDVRQEGALGWRDRVRGPWVVWGRGGRCVGSEVNGAGYFSGDSISKEIMVSEN